MPFFGDGDEAAFVFGWFGRHLGEAATLIAQQALDAAGRQKKLLGHGFLAASAQNDFSRQSQYGRFASIQARGYKQGRAVIRAIYEVYYDNTEADDPQPIEALVMMGDWMWFNGEKTSAKEKVWGASEGDFCKKVALKSSRV